MRRNQEIANMASCLNRCAPDELVFVLTGHDVTAPEVIRYWVAARLRHSQNAPNSAQLSEALTIANLMEQEYDTVRKNR